MSEDKLTRLSRIFSFEKKLREAKNMFELRYIITNELRTISPYVFAFFGEWKGKNVDKTSISDIGFILEEQPDVIIFGTGKNSVTPNRNLVFDLAKKNIGIEAMTTIAASKTYNILISEGRDPVAILLIE